MTTIESLEKRIEAIEREIFLRQPPAPLAGAWKDWRQAIGRFVAGDLSEAVDAAGREIREADRQQSTS